MSKEHTWQSWMYVTTAILVTVLMFGLDVAAVNLGEWVVPLFFILILVGYILSIIFSVITLTCSYERKWVPIIALIITVFNLVVGGFFALFGAMY
ncbi:hypothetical protein KFZ56_00615 [Virgibacillus sp. NKC19-3]|uniref:hypothetical protein n=1 Tax=Virgibacillus saliphilus TaxID=2831674 RepID=UPI001C9BB9C7|nr:hypothetical protein [Virgibacillus sp. NKC19-3]MBY7141631.1 hypothetical protein [Virgibacillus sp. NKC19-3]